MSVTLGEDICRNLTPAESREWLITNGIGSYGAGTISGLLTRRYHGLLIASLKPPTQRTLMLTKLNETVAYNNLDYDLYSDRFEDGTIFPHGYKYIEQFFLDGTTPVWQYRLGDAILEKRIWMQQKENTTYIRYTFKDGSQSLKLSLNALVNYRDHHGDTHADNWQMQIDPVDRGIKVQADRNAIAFYLLAVSNSGNAINWTHNHVWYRNFLLAIEKYRGLTCCEDHLLAGGCSVTLNPGESITVVASTKANPNLDIESAWQQHHTYEQELLTQARSTLFKNTELQSRPEWIEQLTLAANQFIVDRSTAEEGKTIIAGYPWFTDWGRDTMISLPGLTLTIGRAEVARSILRTFAQYVDRGMLPNVFPDGGETPEYNTVDATLWYFEAIYSYYLHTKDKGLIEELFPILSTIITNYRQGTRYNIHQDSDGLIYAGETGVQLTWMDAKVDDWVVTPRIGKPVEINALWYNALIIMERLAQIVGQPQEYTELAASVRQGFQRFWSDRLGYCYDVLDTDNGNDPSLRPNQIFAVSLPAIDAPPLLNRQQQQSVVDRVAKELLTPYGLRSLSPQDSAYQGIYGGDRRERDGQYHQGTTWGWLIGHFIQAHLKVYRQPQTAIAYLNPMAEHLSTGCIGNISEIFDGDSPFTPRGCFAQAWSVAEVLRSWELIQSNS